MVQFHQLNNLIFDGIEQIMFSAKNKEKKDGVIKEEIGKSACFHKHSEKD